MCTHSPGEICHVLTPLSRLLHSAAVAHGAEPRELKRPGQSAGALVRRAALNRAATQVR
jgi:hypothetical protein